MVRNRVVVRNRVRYHHLRYTPPSVSAVLEIRSLHKRYGRVVAVEDVSLRVERGAIFGLLGPNGSGKTTTLACALGLLRPTSGHITVLGVPSERLHTTGGRVGAVFDESVLVRGLSVRAQLVYARSLFGHEGGRTIDEALELVGLAELAARSVTRLSLGQRKRLAVAAALAGAPQLVVLDEPLSGLDPPGAREFLALLRSLSAEGLTILVSSHRLYEMETVLTHAAILIAGRVARAGSLADLLAERGGLALSVDDPERARAVLAGLAGVATTGREPDGRLIVDPGEHTAAEVNRALVQAGVGVSSLAPRNASLPGLFHALVEERGVNVDELELENRAEGAA